jgi:hypothetical protein
MRKWTEQTTFKGRNTNGQYTHEEILSIPGHKGNTHQDDIKISNHSTQNGYHAEYKHLKKWKMGR